MAVKSKYLAWGFSNMIKFPAKVVVGATYSPFSHLTNALLTHFLCLTQKAPVFRKPTLNPVKLRTIKYHYFHYLQKLSEGKPTCHKGHLSFAVVVVM